MTSGVRTICLACVVLSTLGLACSGDEPASTRLLATVASQTVVTGPGGVVVTIPAGALDVDTTIIVQALPARRRPAAAIAVGEGTRLSPEGQLFRAAVSVEMPIDPSRIPVGKTIDDVVVVRADRDALVFVPLPTRRATGTAVLALTEHFSDFVPVVFVDTSTLQGCTDDTCSGGETCLSCPSDCGLCLVANNCGNGICEASEDCTSCAFDCTCTTPLDAGIDAGADAGVDSGVDASMPMPVPTFVDIVHGLEWLSDLEPGTFTQAQTAAACAANTANGQADWRVPTRAELAPLIDYTRIDPAFDPALTTIAAGETMWTSTVAVDNPANFGFAIASTGDQRVLLNTSLLRLRCVRTSVTEVPLEPFFDNADGTVTDSGSGLVWQLVVTPSMLDQASAATDCATLSLGAFASGWRLPTIAELSTLIDDTHSSPAMDPVFGTTAPNGTYWSASASNVNVSSGWGISFVQGLYVTMVPTSPSFHRCVH